MASATPPATPVKLTDEQNRTVGKLSLAALVLCGLLGLLALARIGSSLLLLLSAPLTAGLGIVEGALTGFLGLILLKTSSDLNYVRQVPHLAGAHLTNALGSWKDFALVLAGLAVVSAALTLLRLAY